LRCGNLRRRSIQEFLRLANVEPGDRPAPVAQIGQRQTPVRRAAGIDAHRKSVPFRGEVSEWRPVNSEVAEIRAAFESSVRRAL
jgi:hypothetical protein